MTKGREDILQIRIQDCKILAVENCNLDIIELDMMHIKLFFVLTLLQLFTINAQDKKKYLLRSVMFYNVENLFDTIDDPKTFDDDRTPYGKYHWSGKRYLAKIDRIAEVISGFGIHGKSIIPDLIGLCEIENLQVLRDLTIHPRLRAFHYGIVHDDSPDERGIDVALLYRKSSFIPSSFQNHELIIHNEAMMREYTRDQLVVGGILDGENLYIILNHWPSRRGGEKKTQPYRRAAAMLTRKIIDSIYRVAEFPKIIVMGDFNDNPDDHSVKQVLTTSRYLPVEQAKSFFNPMEDLYKRGAGSLAYKDLWSLFDQIIISQNIVTGSGSSLKYWKAGVYISEVLLTLRGRYIGYPFRTYSGIQYLGGYSDHFPVYLLLIKEIEKRTLIEKRG